MSKKIKTDDGNVEFEVCHLGINVTDHHEQEAIWARLSDAQRVELAAALDPGRRGLHVRLDNQASTLATYRRELDAAENARDTAATRAAQLEKKLAKVMSDYRDVGDAAVSRADIEKALWSKTILTRFLDDSPLVGVSDAVDTICDLFGIEAEQAVDPVEAKAQELYEAARIPDWRDWDQLPPADHDEYYRLARHVLGQEADQ